DRRRRRSRCARRSAMLPTRSSSRSATRGTSPRTGKGSSRRRAPAWRGAAPGCSATRRKAPRRWCPGGRSPSPRRSRRRSGSATPRRGREPSRLGTSPAERSRRSATTRSSLHIASPHVVKACSWSRPPRPRSRGSGSARRRAASRASARWCACSPGTGSRIPTARAPSRARSTRSTRAPTRGGRGLGSSAAAIVGGVVAANALLGEPLDRRSLLRVASEVEGHADNVAAALYGAFTVAVPDDAGPVATRIAFPRAWRICLLIPKEALETETARAVLSPNVSRADAVFNLAHAAALLAAVLRSDGALLSIAMADRLHQPARAKLVPDLDDVVGAARGAGAFGAALSG